MCGIAGIIKKDKSVSQSEIKKMTDLMAHRGPDGEGFFCKDNLGFGHRRLSIIDLEGGKQPFCSSDEKYVITFNGEIYNFQELKKELQNNHRFFTSSDTEVLLTAYQEWGVNCLNKLRGMFSFAIFDRDKNRVFIARDRVGIKPLYYSINQNLFCFASEINPILEIIGQSELSKTGFINYLRFGYTGEKDSIFDKIKKLPPANYMIYDLSNHQTTIDQYWSINIQNKIDITEDDALNHFNDLLDETIDQHLLSDVAFGSFLSGGVDSGLITSIMKTRLKKTVKSFTIGFNDPLITESKEAKRAAELIGTEHYEKSVNNEFDKELIVKLLNQFGEPFADSSFLPTFFVSQCAAEHVKMVLSGDGGDELFAGYNTYPILQNQIRYPYVFKSIGIISKIMELFFHNKNRWQFQQLDIIGKHDVRMSHFLNSETKKLLLNHTSFIDTDNLYDTPYNKLDLDYFLLKDFSTYMTDDVLTKVDRMSMANSIEVRVPLLDHKIVEFAFSLPLDFKIKKAGLFTYQKKIMLKKSAERYLPWNHLITPKKGFAIPLVKWVQNEYRQTILTELINQDNPIYHFLDKQAVNRLLYIDYKTSPSHSLKIWNLFIFSLWLKKYQSYIIFR